MSNNFNIRGTREQSFRIGVNGASIFSGTTNPPNPLTGTDGDLFVIASGGSSAFYQKVAGTWTGVTLPPIISDIAAITPGTNDFIVGNGSTWMGQSSNSVKGILNLGTANSPTFNSLDLTGGLVVGTPSGGNLGSGSINAQSIYVNGTAVGTGGSSTLGGLTDVTLSSPTNLDILQYNGTDWVNRAIGTASNIQSHSSNLDNLSLLSAGTNNFIVGNGTTWSSLSSSSSRNALGLGTGDTPVFDGLVVNNDITADNILRGAIANASIYSDLGTATVTIGGTSSTIVIAGNLQVDGTTTTVNSTNLDVVDKNITVNLGGNTAGASLSGINIEGDSAAVVGYIRVALNNADLEFKAPTGQSITFDVNVPTQIDFSSAAVGQVIRYDGTNYENSFVGINDLGDVVITAPSANQLIQFDGTNWINATVTIGTGDVTGPASSTVDAIARFDGTTGKLIKNSSVTVDNTGNISANSLDVVNKLVTRNNLELGTNDLVIFGGIENTNGTHAREFTRVLYNTTTNDTTTEVWLDGASQQLVMTNDTTWMYDVRLVARRTDADNECATFKFEGAVDRNATPSSIALIGSPESSSNKDSGAATWSAQIVADGATGALAIQITGENTKTIKWVARVNITESRG